MSGGLSRLQEVLAYSGPFVSGDRRRAMVARSFEQ